jgi:hypothetical protein
MHALQSCSSAWCARPSCFHITSTTVVTVPEQDHWGSIPTPAGGRSPLLVILSSNLTPIIHYLKSQSSHAEFNRALQKDVCVDSTVEMMDTTHYQSPTRIAFPHCIERKSLVFDISLFLPHCAILLLSLPRALSELLLSPPPYAPDCAAPTSRAAQASPHSHYPSSLPLSTRGGAAPYRAIAHRKRGRVESGIPLTHGSA